MILLRFVPLVFLAGCLAKIELPDPAGQSGTAQSEDEIGDGDAGFVESEPPCGGTGEACCAAPQPACGDQLRCDAASGTCLRAEPRLCTLPTASDTNAGSECPSGQQCCPAGLLGNCVALAPGAECPAPDLTIVTTEAEFKASLWREDRVFDPNDPADRCAFEKGCVGGPGLRRLLRFSLEVKNEGDADLLIGAPGASAAFATAECDGQPYLDGYLLFDLLSLDGVPVPGVQGRRQARCQAVPDGFTTLIGCDFFGLWSGYSETYSPYDDGSYSPLGGPTTTECQWLDVTGVPAAEYRLRVRVNANADQTPMLTEKRTDNNEVRFAVTIPQFEAPTQPCPDSELDSDVTNDNPLWGFSVSRECGWTPAPLAGGNACTPGQPTTIGCSACNGAPALRVCEGANASCAAGSAIASADYTYDGSCPLASFRCPTSGTYTAMQSSAFAADTFECGLSELDIDPLAPCSGTPIGATYGLRRECGWASALTSSCTAGDAIVVRCSNCNADWMMRVCEGEGSCADGLALASADETYDANGLYISSCPVVTFDCPASGDYAALVAAYDPFAAIPDCDIAVSAATPGGS